MLTPALYNRLDVLKRTALLLGVSNKAAVPANGLSNEDGDEAEFEATL